MKRNRYAGYIQPIIYIPILQCFEPNLSSKFHVEPFTQFRLENIFLQFAFKINQNVDKR